MPHFLETNATSPDAYNEILALLRDFTAKAARPSDAWDFSIQLRETEQGPLVGGLWAQSLFGGFHVDMVVVGEAYRGRGYGSLLMERAQAEALKRRCHMMWLDTFQFQARSFYERLGFEVRGKLDGPPPIYPRYIMYKPLGE